MGTSEDEEDVVFQEERHLDELAYVNMQPKKNLREDGYVPKAPKPSIEKPPGHSIVHPPPILNIFSW